MICQPGTSASSGRGLCRLRKEPSRAEQYAGVGGICEEQAFVMLNSNTSVCNSWGGLHANSLCSTRPKLLQVAMAWMTQLGIIRYGRAV
eukprot:368913-Amphidinium_carterae.1